VANTEKQLDLLVVDGGISVRGVCTPFFLLGLIFQHTNEPITFDN
jgi:hypothetical protein